MNRLTRSLPGTALLLAAVLSSACGQKPTEIRLKSTKLKVYGLGRSVSVGGDVVDKKGQIVAGKAVSWESSNPKVATVDAQTGSVKTASQGKAKITAPARRPALEAVVALEVLDVAIVNVFPPRTTLAGPAGSTFPLTLEVKDSTSKVVELKAEWTSSA
ncbi:MAG: Ig-like domain-containing protein [Holophagales bacterium]|nr:Ig-like domain-containing protein [Holophagales bacterium]